MGLTLRPRPPRWSTLPLRSGRCLGWDDYADTVGPRTLAGQKPLRRWLGQLLEDRAAVAAPPTACFTTHRASNAATTNQHGRAPLQPAPGSGSEVERHPLRGRYFRRSGRFMKCPTEALGGKAEGLAPPTGGHRRSIIVVGSC